MFRWLRRQAENSSTVPSSLVPPRRRFADAVPYILPNDPDEVNRLDFQHFMIRHLFGGNIVTPLRTTPNAVLDVGCGTGRWAAEVATQFPMATVTGVDIDASLLGSTMTIPANFTFIQANILEGLPFADASFDFVHQRFLVLGIPTPRWPSVIQELWRVTRPGGWIELVEAVNPYGNGVALGRLMDWGAQMAKRRDLDASAMAHLDDLMRSGGLRHVTLRRFDVPIGKQYGRLGQWCATDLQTIVKAVREPVLKLNLASPEAFDATMAEFQRESEDPSIQQYWPFLYAYGQK